MISAIEKALPIGVRISGLVDAHDQRKKDSTARLQSIIDQVEAANRDIDRLQASDDIEGASRELPRLKETLELLNARYERERAVDYSNFDAAERREIAEEIQKLQRAADPRSQIREMLEENFPGMGTDLIAMKARDIFEAMRAFTPWRKAHLASQFPLDGNATVARLNEAWHALQPHLQTPWRLALLQGEPIEA